MNIHCCLPSIALSQIERAFPSPHRVSMSSDWNVALAKLADPECDAVIVDPTVGGDHVASHRLAALSATLLKSARAPIVGYVSVTATSIKVAHTMARLGASDVIVRGLDDSAAALRATVQRVIADHAADRLVSGSTHLLAGLPPAVAEAVVTLFRRPERTHSIDDLASAAGTTRRTLDRHLARAGLAPARTLIACARAHAAYGLLAVGGARVSGAATLVGYASTRALTRELRALTGHTPAAIPSRLPPELFAATVRRHLLRADTG